jgi:hypothetical protein
VPEKKGARLRRMAGEAVDWRKRSFDKAGR